MTYWAIARLSSGWVVQPGILSGLVCVSVMMVRANLLHEKDKLDAEVGKAIDLLNKLTTGTAAQAKAEEARTVRIDWTITAIATTLGLIFAWWVSRFDAGLAAYRQNMPPADWDGIWVATGK